jgi:hypothetical protein
MSESDQAVMETHIPTLTPREALPGISKPDSQEVEPNTAKELAKAIRFINGTKDRAVRSPSMPLARDSWIARVTKNPQTEGLLNLTFNFTDVYGKHTTIVYLNPDNTFQYRGNSDAENYPLSQTAADYLLSVLPRNEK